MLVEKIKSPKTTVLVVLIWLLVLGRICPADTFTNLKTGEVLHGYATGKTEDAKTTVNTQEKAALELNLADWEISPDRQGRNNKVIVLTLDRMIMYEIETAALQQALTEAVAEGPLFILLELDSPGGRVDLAQRLTAAITATGACRVVCFVTGGEHAGAISAAAAVALSCDKIYMANRTVIGGAAVIAVSREGTPTGIKKAYGEEVGEKFSSIWQANFASLAEQNNRPSLLARAMVDKDIEVIEVTDAGTRLFIDPVNKKPGQNVIKTWTQKGSLLTLTAAEAASCIIADKIIDSREQLLRHLDAADAEIVTNNAVQNAGKELSRARLKVRKLRKKIDLEIKQLQQAQKRARGMSLVRKVRGSLRQLLVLARQYPDLQLNVTAIEDEYNSIEAFYQQHKRLRK